MHCNSTFIGINSNFFKIFLNMQCVELPTCILPGGYNLYCVFYFSYKIVFWIINLNHRNIFVLLVFSVEVFANTKNDWTKNQEPSMYWSVVRAELKCLHKKGFFFSIFPHALYIHSAWYFFLILTKLKTVRMSFHRQKMYAEWI